MSCDKQGITHPVKAHYGSLVGIAEQRRGRQDLLERPLGFGNRLNYFSSNGLDAMNELVRFLQPQFIDMLVTASRFTIGLDPTVF